MEGWASSGVNADPGRVHTEGRIARAALEDGRDQVAAFFGVRPRQVIFTSGGTESINAAVWGATRQANGPVVCSAVEHSAVRDSSARSAAVILPAVDGLGIVHPQAVEDAVQRCQLEFGLLPSLVHCQWANHEVGSLQPVEAIVARCRQLGVLSHVDAVAAAGYLPVDAGALDADRRTRSRRRAHLARESRRIPVVLRHYDRAFLDLEDVGPAKLQRLTDRLERPELLL